MDQVKTGALISELRKEKKLTQSELANLLHVTDKAVSRWETGRGMPDLTSLESLSSVLDVSVAELLRGERLAETVSRETVKELSLEGFQTTRDIVRKRKIFTVAFSTIFFFILLANLLIFLNSPIYIQWSDGLLTPEVSDDGRITAVLPTGAAGCETETFSVSGNGQKEVFVYCYRTLWSIFSRKTSSAIVLLGNSDSVDYIRYCPGAYNDIIIYSRPGLSAPCESFMLPSYPFGSVVLKSVFGSIVTWIIGFSLRKEGLMIPNWLPLLWLADLLSVLLWSLALHGKMYNTPFYTVGVALLSILIIVLTGIVLHIFEKKKRQPSPGSLQN